jgi:RNA polymerase primary sigma factor
MNRTVDPERHIGLVRTIALAYGARGLDDDDLAQEGMIGLLRACELFDPGRGTKFSTYASWWIKEAIGRALEEQAHTVRVPHYVRTRSNKVRRGEIDPDADLKSWQRFNLDRGRAAVAARAEQEPEPGSGRTPLEELAVDHREADPSDFGDAEDLGRLLAAVEALPALDRDVIRMRFGLGCEPGCEPMSRRAIGEHLGVTYGMVRWIESRAIGELGRAVGGGEGIQSDPPRSPLPSPHSRPRAFRSSQP